MKTDTPSLSIEKLLQVIFTCFNHGVVYIVRNDHGLCGVCCVDATNDCLVLKSIPNDKGTGVAKACMEAIRQWGKARGFESLTVSTERLNGSSFRYFEKSLGFRRKYVTFTLEL